MSDQIIVHDTHMIEFIIIASICIIVVLGISYPVDKQEELIRASKTIGVLLLMISGVMLALLGYQYYNSHEETYGIISSTA